MRQLSDPGELADIARGAAILGTGGGGDPYVGELLAREAVGRHGPVTLVSLDEVPEDALVATVACLGAPTVLREKLPAGTEGPTAFKALQAYLGQEVTHVLPVEVGGLNSMIPIAVAAELGLPLVDADLMGRAFPEFQMVLATLAGIDGSPMSMADDKGNAAVFETLDNKWAERFARSMSVEMGAMAFVGSYSMSGAQLRGCAVVDTMSFAQSLGAATRDAADSRLGPVEALREALGAVRLLEGKVLDVDREMRAGFGHVECVLEGVGEHAGSTVRLHAQNEYLLAEADGELLGCTPDLLFVVESETALPVTAEEIRYGMRVTLLASPCDPRWRSAEGLALVGPAYFGYDVDYSPIEVLTSARRAGH